MPTTRPTMSRPPTGLTGSSTHQCSCTPPPGVPSDAHVAWTVLSLSHCTLILARRHTDDATALIKTGLDPIALLQAQANVLSRRVRTTLTLAGFACMKLLCHFVSGAPLGSHAWEGRRQV